MLDCWFESGSLPYAQWGYPRANQEEFKKGFPADFIAEGLDQTRGWFYTLMVIGSGLFKRAPFRNVVVNGLGAQVRLELTFVVHADVRVTRNRAVRRRLCQCEVVADDQRRPTDSGTALRRWLRAQRRSAGQSAPRIVAPLATSNSSALRRRSTRLG